MNTCPITAPARVAYDAYKRLVEMRDAERIMAYTYARHVVDSCFLFHSKSESIRPGGDWHIEVGTTADKMADTCLRYLEHRGLLQRMPGSPHIVRVLDEPKVCGWDDKPGEFD